MLAGRSDRAWVLDRLAVVAMSDYAARYPHQLSGGQMQRVGIARALVHRPRLLLADEPTGNLDTATGDAVLDVLRRVAKEQGAAIMMATHSAESAAVTDRTVCMRDGHIERIERH